MMANYSNRSGQFEGSPGSTVAAMIYLEFQGKRIDPSQLQDALEAAVLEQCIESVRKQVASIRDPETGEFPTIVVRATSLSDITLHIEGSDALIAQVRERLGLADDNEASDAADPVEASRPAETAPARKVFLSWATEDREVVSRLAEALLAEGIDVWWAPWEIRAGESIRQRIEAGLAECSHFLVLLSPVSITKPWVNAEIDAGFVLALERQAKLLPVRIGLQPADIPPLLRGRLAPSIDEFEAGVKTLVAAILDLTIKPPLGPAPKAVSANGRTRFSQAATAIAEVFVKRTLNALEFDPQLSRDDLAQATDLTPDDVSDGLFELRAMVRERDYSGGNTVTARSSLYAEFDALFHPWKPAEDALMLAADLVNDEAFPSNPDLIAQRYGWPPRRLNPAVAYLMERDAVEVNTAIGDGRYIGFRIRATDATRRFVRSRTIGS